MRSGELDSVPRKKWKDVNVKTMKGFMAVFIMGLVRKNELTDYWSTRQSMNTPWFRMIFSRDHFRNILHAFHIVDNSIIPAKDDPYYRPSVRLRPLLDYMNNICIHYFSPGQAVAIDQNLVAGKEHNPIRQYLPNKHHARFGTNVRLIADSNTAYVLQSYVYVSTKGTIFLQIIFSRLMLQLPTSLKEATF